MYEETGNSIYLKYVTGTAEWLISGPDKIVNPSGYEWRFNRPYYSDYPLDGEGRIALFFYEIYEDLGNTTYLEYARGAMNWLLSQAVVNDGTAKWFDPVLGCYRTLPFSGAGMGGIAGFWGVPEPNELLMAVYEITNNATYLDYAEKLGNWITSMAIPEGGGYKFPDAEGSSTYSAYQNARIYNFLSWLYSVTGVTSYSEYADGALQWIIFNATEANGGYEWRTISYFPYYATWFEHGAAGIGYYLITAPAIAVPLQISMSPLSASIYVGDSVAFTSTVNGGTPPYSYQWYLNNNPTSGATLNTWTFTPTTAGNYTVHLNVTDNLGNIAKSNEASVTVAAQLTASVSPMSASVLVGQPVAFTSTVSGGYTPYSYQWYLNGNPVSGANATSWTFTPTSSGIYYVHLKVTDDKGNTAQSETARIAVATVPVGGYSFPIQLQTKAEPIIPYIALIATLTAIFTKLRPKTKRKR
jgi:hypothetical protein